MKPKEYWIARAERVLLAGERHGDELIKALTGFYTDTSNQLQTQIDAFYGRYATENAVTLAQAHKQLDKRQLKSFRENLEKYLAEANQLQLGNIHEQYLRSLSTKAAISRYQELLAQARHQIEVLAAKGEAVFSGTLEEVCTESYYRTLFDIQHGIGFGVDFARMDIKTIERLMRTPWLGDNYSSRIWKNKEALILQLEQIIPQAFSIGYNSRVLGQRIASRLGVSKSAGERLARTEVNHAANEAAKAAYQESGVEEYEYLATLDNRTSEICAALDGKVFRVSDSQTGVNYPPMHPNCRSTTVPYFPPDEFDEPASRAARDMSGRYYTVPADMTYPQWQKKYLGEKLTGAEERAINSYIGAPSYSLNAKLRDGVPLSTEEKRSARALDSAIEKLPKYQGTVQRSLFFDTPQEAQEFLRSLVQDEVSFPAYTSASTVVYDEGDNVRLVIHSKTGADVRGFNRKEQEIIFGRGSVFRATKMEIIDGKPVVYLEEADDGETQ